MLTTKVPDMKSLNKYQCRGRFGPLLVRASSGNNAAIKYLRIQTKLYFDNFKRNKIKEVVQVGNQMYETEIYIVEKCKPI